VVYVPAGLYRIDAWLEVSLPRVVIAGDGPALSRLWFTRRIGLNFAAHIRFGGLETVTLEAPLLNDVAALDSVLEVDDAAAFTAGDDVLLGQTISLDFIAEHGVPLAWQVFTGTWAPFYRRNIVQVDTTSTPHRLTLDVPLRHPLRTAYGATVRRVTGLLREVGLEDLGLANAMSWEDAWAGKQINLVTFDHVADGWVRNVASFPSPAAPESGMGAGAHIQSNGILVDHSNRVTVADCRLELAQKRGGGGANGYLFEIRDSSEVLTRDSSARAGHRNFVQNWGFGTSGCVWLRVQSSEGAQIPLGPLLDTAFPAPGELLHTLAAGNLVDASRFDDGFRATPRGPDPDELGQSATECAFWNFSGSEVISRQFGLGYVVGTSPETYIGTSLQVSDGMSTAPEDWVEGRGQAATLVPASLYEDQLARRLAKRTTR